MEISEEQMTILLKALEEDRITQTRFIELVRLLTESKI